MARIGKFGARISPQSFAKHLIEKLDCKNIRASFADKDIQTVALVGGSGKDFLEDAYNCGADAFGIVLYEFVKTYIVMKL